MARNEQSSVNERIRAPAEGSQCRSVAIMITDVVGFTTHLQRLGDEPALQLFRAHDRILRRMLELHGGICINHTGDGFVVGFESVCSAAECALAIRRHMCEHEELRSTHVRLRIALGYGEVLLEQGRLFGLSVIAAFRLCARTPADRIYATTGFAERAARLGYTFGRANRVRLKGIRTKEVVCELASRGVDWASSQPTVRANQPRM